MSTKSQESERLKPSDLLNVPTSDLCDSLGLGNGVHALPPIFRNFGRKQQFAGPVTTVKCHEDNGLIKEAITQGGAQGNVAKVLVVDGGGSLRGALLGGNMAATAIKNGWAGIVINGSVRDAAELAVCDIGLCALALTPMPTVTRGEGQRDVPVQIQGVWVRPGDWVAADADGIVVISMPSDR